MVADRCREVTYAVRVGDIRPQRHGDLLVRVACTSLRGMDLSSSDVRDELAREVACELERRRRLIRQVLRLVQPVRLREAGAVEDGRGLLEGVVESWLLEAVAE